MTPLFGTAVQDYYLDLVRKNFTARKARLEALRTKEDAERYVAGVRAKIAKLFPFPAEKTPLDAQETGTLDFGSYVMHKIIYYSRPKYPVTGNLYLPKTTEKVPAVLFLCGHSGNGPRPGYGACGHEPFLQGIRLPQHQHPGDKP